MLYNEFIQNTNCKQTDYNYSVYKALEALYMVNDTITKEAVYKAGKLLIDNSETPAEKEAREEREQIIADLENEIAKSEEYRKQCQHAIIDAVEPAQRKYWKEEAKYYTDLIKDYKGRLKMLKA